MQEIFFKIPYILFSQKAFLTQRKGEKSENRKKMAIALAGFTDCPLAGGGAQRPRRRYGRCAKGKKPAISEDWVSQPEKVEPEPPPVDYLTKEPTARQTSPETETGQVQGVSDQRPDGWRIFWGILVALLIAAAVVVGIVLMVPKEENKQGGDDRK